MRLFDDDDVRATPIEIASGATLVPGWLPLDQQRWIVHQYQLWAQGPVPPHAPRVRGHDMSVRTLCLGWHWRPFAYTREARDVNGQRVLAIPQWLVQLGQRALVSASGDPHAGEDYLPDVALVNYYDDAARMGMHQDRDEHSLAPVVSMSIGDECRFRFGNTTTRQRPYRDLTLHSGDLFVFGGASRLAFHGVLNVTPDTAPVECGLSRGRLNITLRVTGLA